MKIVFLCIVSWVLFTCSSAAIAGEAQEVVRVAVAANFAGTAELLAASYETACGCDVQISAASTGKHYAQIRNGAPYDVFLAADAVHPEKLEAEGFGVGGSRFTYALGRLALYGGSDSTLAAEDILRATAYQHLAIPNPELAPYGAAAVEYLKHEGLWEGALDRLVFGENVAQAQHFVDSGNAEYGFVAFAQVKENSLFQVRLIDEDKHSPIRQDAVLLAQGNANAAARGFLAFLRGAAARAIISAAGYGLDPVVSLEGERGKDEEASEENGVEVDGAQTLRPGNG